MKYRITIEEIEEKKVIKNVYVPEKINKGGTKGAYADTEVKEEVSTKIFEQTRTTALFDLMGTIQAFNK